MSAVSMTRPRGLSLAALNGRYHRAALNAFMVVVLAHWAEHLVQAYQATGLDPAALPGPDGHPAR
jgi:hypothetical protein